MRYHHTYNTGDTTKPEHTRKPQDASTPLLDTTTGSQPYPSHTFTHNTSILQPEAQKLVGGESTKSTQFSHPPQPHRTTVTMGKSWGEGPRPQNTTLQTCITHCTTTVLAPSYTEPTEFSPWHYCTRVGCTLPPDTYRSLCGHRCMCMPSNTPKHTVLPVCQGMTHGTNWTHMCCE